MAHKFHKKIKGSLPKETISQGEIYVLIKSFRESDELDKGVAFICENKNSISDVGPLSEAIAICIKTKDYDLADEIISRVIRQSPNRSDAIRRKADIRHRMGDAKESLSWSKFYFETERSVESKAFYASFVKRSVSPRQALEILGDATKENISNDAWLSECLDSLVRLGKAAQCKDLLEKVDFEKIKKNNTKVMYASAAILADVSSCESFHKLVPRNKHISDYDRHELSMCLSIFVNKRVEETTVSKVELRDFLKGNCTIVQYWNDFGKLTDDVKCSIDLWKSVEGFEYKIFDREMARNFIRSHFGNFVLGAFDKSLHPAQEADIFRLAYLCVMGGVYIDIDILPKKSFGNIKVDGKKVDFIYFRDNLAPHYRELLNSFIISSGNSPFLYSALCKAVANVAMTARRGIWRDTGPGMLGEQYVSEVYIHTAGLIKHSDLFGSCLSHKKSWDYKTSQNSWQRADKF